MTKSFLKWGTKSNRILHVMLIFLLCVPLLYVLITLKDVVDPTVTYGYMDFPCFASISDDGCLYASSYYSRDEAVNDDISVYIDTFEAGWEGGGCVYEASNTSEVNIEGHLLKRDGETLIIDDKVMVEKYGEWEEENIVAPWNPWQLMQEKISIINYGIASCARDYATDNLITPYMPALVVIGSSGTYYEDNNAGFVILGASIGLLTCVIASLILSFMKGRRGKV